MRQVLYLIGILAAASTWAQQAQAPVPNEAASATKPAKEPASIHQSDSVSGTKPIKAAAPGQGKPASGTKPAKAPAKPVTNPVSKKSGTASKAATKPKAAPKPPPKAKAKPAPAKPARKVKPARKAKPKPPARKPVPAASPDASQAAPGAATAPAPRQPAHRHILGKQEAEARYRDAVELEQRGDMQAAVTAYHQAAESGHGPAQKKLGDFYGTGNEVVERDYETSLRWYERARQQGIEPRKPFAYPGVRR